MDPGYIGTEQAADYLSLSRRTLEKLRLNGNGPRFYKARGGRLVRYRVEDLDRWMTSRTSTSDPGPEASHAG